MLKDTFLFPVSATTHFSGCIRDILIERLMAHFSKLRTGSIIDILNSSLNSSETTTNAANFTFDDYGWARWLLLTIVILIQFFVPICHSAKHTSNGRSYRILSFYAFLAFYAWLSFYICCASTHCYQYGDVMNDLSIFCNVMLPLCYLYMIGESCISAEFFSLVNILEDSSITDYIEKLRKAIPGRYCTVKCYKYGWCQKKIMSFKESKLFSFEHSIDLSEETPVSANGMTRICLSMDIDFGDQETAEKYREFEVEVLNANSHKGDHASVSHHDFIPGFHDVVCGHSGKSQMPCWINPSFYVLISILGLSWPYR